VVKREAMRERREASVERGDAVKNMAEI